MNKYGYYTKHFTPEKDVILSFDAICDTFDNHHEANKLCGATSFQVIEERKDTKFYEFTYNDSSFVKDIEKYFNTLLYSFYNIYGQRVNNLIVHFDFENSVITVNDRTLKVVEDREFTYKVLKTKIKAINGIKGLYKHILGAMHIDSALNSSTYKVLCAIGNIADWKY